MLGFLFPGKTNTATLNGNGHAGGMAEIGKNILQGGHGKALLEEKRRVAHQRVAEQRKKIMQGFPALMSMMGAAHLQTTLAVVLSLVAQMDRTGRGVASILTDVIGRESRTLTAYFREFCVSKNIFRPVASAEPMPNIIALYVAFACLETAANTSIFFGQGLFPSIESAVLFSATLASVNLGLAWAFGFLILRNWNHSSPKVRAWSRRSLLPLVVGWLLLHGGAVVLRLSENLSFTELRFQDFELMDGFASLMLVLIGVLTTTICAYKAYKKCGDVDSELHEINRDCKGKPREAAERTADTGQADLDEWRDQAQEQLNQARAKLDEVETTLSRDKAAAEQGRKDLAALAADLQKEFSVSIANVSTSEKYRWSQAGPTHAGLEFSTEELSIQWDEEGEAQVRAFIQRWREQLTEAQKEVERAYAEASARITKGLEDISKHQNFWPEVSS